MNTQLTSTQVVRGVRLHGDEGREVSPGVAQCDGGLPAECRLPQKRNHKRHTNHPIHTFKSRIAQVLPTETLDTLHPVHNDGAAKDVRQDEYMKLLKCGAGLGGEADKLSPLLQYLAFRDVIVKKSCLPSLILLPSGVEPVWGTRDNRTVSRHDTYK
ncbi:hypothetical protein E2C01_009618 [Portunus trituberculatus]|uniref:Uncharacterized protein n=1 Tax=Portunus trituberculatus TaxID=210409 RepID=A0A5B7D677_PORTR|nr:hypothetical protein [Portunus trituberculatus]